MPKYETRLRHFTFSIENGSFIITSELDDSFERTAKLGPVISSVAQEYQGNPFKRQEAIHQELYLPVLSEWDAYQAGDASATGSLFEKGNNGKGN